MTGYVAQLREAVAAVQITSPTAFRWFGAPSQPLAPALRRAITPDVARSYLLFVLRNHLYTNFYRVGFASRMAPEMGEASAACQETDLAGLLAAANHGRGSWDGSWTIARRDGEHLVIRREGLELWAAPSECSARPGTVPAPGAEVALRMPSESFELSPGYYCAFSDEHMASDSGHTLLRIYWNVTPAGAPRLVSELTRRLNVARHPFRLKVLSDAISYGRCDTAVLYMRKPDAWEAVRELAGAYEACRAVLRRGVPALTRRLGHGVAIAEDPGNGESFGQHLCETVADGLIGAFERGERDLDARMRAVTERLAAAGVDLQRPYLKAGSDDNYDLALEVAPAPASRRRDPRPATAGDADYLDTALRIGDRLTTEAIWHHDRCNWLALLPEAYGRHVALSYGALGEELYDGTSGIALFLAQLHCVTGDEKARTTALGAIRHALRAAEARPVGAGSGLYTGATGVALVAAAVAALLDEDELAAGALRVVTRMARAPKADPGFDVLSGRAGAIVGLLAVHALIEKPRVLQLALRLADELVATASQTDHGWSWRTEGPLAHPDLLGLSHGAAGAAHAFLELHDITGDAAFRDGAEGALAYEASWFDARTQNWPDLREERRRLARGHAATFRTQWCHGAPGIALVRLRAAEVLGTEPYAAQARLALQTTVTNTDAAAADETLSWCLCHGLAGNVDVLLEGRRRLDRASGGQLPEALAAIGIDSHIGRGLPWPCGIPVPGREVPGLMLGLAGIGYFFLRMACPAVPSVLLLPTRELPLALRGLAAR
jgi:class II lanthipeptide synthase